VSAPRVLGAVLAGGRARRFGSDKAVATLHGRRLVDLAVASLSMCDAVVVCGRRLEGFVCLDDRPGPELGPLAGLAAALHHARTHGFDGVLTTGCDMPEFPEVLARELIGVTAAVVAGQHLAAYWPVGLSERLDAHLGAGGDRSIYAWIAVTQPRRVETGAPLPNINTPADLDALAGHSAMPTSARPR
jgi:molybdopterin-guanine dinucleotide biosynthesis protein A